MGCSNSHETGAVSRAPQRVHVNVEPSTDGVHDNNVEGRETVNAAKLLVDETMTISDDPKDDKGETEDTNETAAKSSDLHRSDAGTTYNPVVDGKVSSEDRDDAGKVSSDDAGKVSSDDRDDAASQEHFEHAVRSACLLLRPEALLECANRNVYKLVLHRSLPHHIALRDLLRKLPNLQVSIQ